MVVTQKPCSWDGDYRTFEALASGAAVAMDAPSAAEAQGATLHGGLAVPPLRHGVHAVFFDAVDEASFKGAVLSLLDASPLRRYRIARRGHILSLTHHRSVSRVDHAFTALAAAWRLWPTGDLAALAAGNYSAPGAARAWGWGS